MTNTRVKRTKNRETLKKTHTQMRKHNENTDSSKQHGEDNALNPQTKGTDTTITTEPAKRNTKHYGCTGFVVVPRFLAAKHLPS